MLGSENGIDLASQEQEEILNVELMPPRPEREQVLLRQPEEAHRRIHAPAVFRMRRARELFLQMHEPAGRLDGEVLRIGSKKRRLADRRAAASSAALPMPTTPSVTMSGAKYAVASGNR